MSLYFLLNKTSQFEPNEKKALMNIFGVHTFRPINTAHVFHRKSHLFTRYANTWSTSIGGFRNFAASQQTPIFRLVWFGAFTTNLSIFRISNSSQIPNNLRKFIHLFVCLWSHFTCKRVDDISLTRFETIQWRNKRHTKMYCPTRKNCS